MTNIRVLRPADLTPEHLDAWRLLQASDRELERPFFAPEYYRILSEFRPDVFVALIEQHSAIVGFFPFQRTSASVGRPVGLRLNDFQGVIAAPDLDLDPLQLLRGCGLSSYHFDHLLAHQPVFRKFQVSLTESPFADLSQGFDAYAEERRAAGRGWVSQVRRKARKMVRDVGDLRFEFDCRDRRVFEQLLVWKSLQRQRTGTDDLLRFEWVRGVLDRMFDTQEPALSGRLSALYAGSRLVAAHFGIICRKSLHLWFPAYDIEVDRFSPGQIMMVELLRAAADSGIVRADFGKGQDRYKLSMATKSVMVAEGCADTRWIGRFLTSAAYQGRSWLRDSPLREVVQGPKRRWRKFMNRGVPEGS